MIHKSEQIFSRSKLYLNRFCPVIRNFNQVIIEDFRLFSFSDRCLKPAAYSFCLSGLTEYGKIILTLCLYIYLKPKLTAQLTDRRSIRSRSVKCTDSDYIFAFFICTASRNDTVLYR